MKAKIVLAAGLLNIGAAIVLPLVAEDPFLKVFTVCWNGALGAFCLYRFRVYNREAPK